MSMRQRNKQLNWIVGNDRLTFDAIASSIWSELFQQELLEVGHYVRVVEADDPTDHASATKNYARINVAVVGTRITKIVSIG